MACSLFNGQLDGVSLRDLMRTGLAPEDVSRFAAQVVGIEQRPAARPGVAPADQPRTRRAPAGREHREHGGRAGRDGGALSAARRAAAQRPVPLQPHRGIQPAGRPGHRGRARGGHGPAPARTCRRRPATGAARSPDAGQRRRRRRAHQARGLRHASPIAAQHAAVAVPR